MSILFSNPNCCLIDHADYSYRLYKDVQISQFVTQNFMLSRKLFSIKYCAKGINRKRGPNSADSEEEVAMVEGMFNNFIEEISPELKKKIYDKYNVLDTGDVRHLTKQLFEATAFEHAGISAGNNSEVPLKQDINNEEFLIPQNCKFHCGCVKAKCEKLNGSRYDIVISDPPWWNKYIRRLKNANEKWSYTMMYNEDIASIPVTNLFSDNCLVAIWCTNAQSNIAAVKELIFPKWGVEYLTTWYWLKVSIELKPMCPFGKGSQKQPYERIILGKVGEVGKVTDNLLLVSVPSALHSHKPPLLDLLRPCVEVENPQILELFARYLLPNTTSVGYEPLKWQHLSLYDNVT